MPEASPAPLDLQDVQVEGITVTRQEQASEEGGLQARGVVVLHMADGVGAGGQLRFGNFGLRASVAYLPQFFIVDKDPWDNEFARFELTDSIQLNVDALVLFGSSEKGASLSYRYSSLLGHGAGVAYQSSFDFVGQRFALSIPIIFYPDATDRVRRDLGLTTERVNFPLGPRFDYGVGIAWLF